MIRKAALFILLIALVYPICAEAKDYFQQKLLYKIDARLIAAGNQIRATQDLVYINNSPDTLKKIYFHLYFNKYRKGAYMQNRRRPFQRGYIEILSVQEEGRENQNFIVDYTLMDLVLHEPILPGDSVRFKIKFTAQLPPSSGRYGAMDQHVDAGNWYPAPVVYDKHGWHLHQHIDNEFYQEWADYRVNLRVPAGYVVGATGNLLNPAQALKDTAAAIKNQRFDNPDDTTTTLWQFEAKMVHDFAWTADPDYVLLRNEWNGITLNVLAMSDNVDNWRQITDWGADALKFLYENFGAYPYKQMTIADTYIRAGGIEYPNIVFINTSIGPDYSLNHFRALVIHEMAHNWFYGLLASNQTEDEWLDEGFTTYAEVRCMEALFGRYDNYHYNRNTWLSRWFYVENDDRRDNALEYLWWTKSGDELDPVDYMADYFRDGVYTSQYAKMNNILFMLEYVLGDSVFQLGMLNYYERWHFKHPGAQDFIAVMEETCGYELDWFFEQWLRSTRQLDYAVESVSVEKLENHAVRPYRAEIILSNKGDIFMPLNLDITLADGTTERMRIPVSPYHSAYEERPRLPYWHFTQENYRAELLLKQKIDYVEIDSSLRLMDVNRLDNRSGLLPPMQFVFMRPQSAAPPLDKYLWEIWPIAFYNDYDKIKIGLKFKGGYLDTDHLFTARFWYKTAYGGGDTDLRYKHPTGWPGRRSWFKLRGYILDGHQGGQVALSKQINKSGRQEPFYRLQIELNANHMYGEQYQTVPWTKGYLNTLILSWERNLERYWKSNSRIKLHLRNSVFGSKYSFSQTELNWHKQLMSVRHNFELHLKFRGGYSEGRVPAQHLFALSGLNGWQILNEPFYRSRGIMHYTLFRKGYFYATDGAQVRGYGLYPDDTPLYGEKTLILTSELLMPNPLEFTPIPLIRNLKPRAFLDIGQVWDHNFPAYRNFRKSAGFSFVYDAFYWINFLIPIENVRFDFPVWMSHVPEGAKHNAWRWLISAKFDLESF